MQVSLSELESVWLDAMNEGYISGSKPEIVVAQNFTKGFTYRSPLGKYLVTDRWHFGLGRLSAGETLILQDGIPVWVMYYYGSYQEQAIPLLKTALTDTYRDKREFVGGRGPLFMVGSDMSYQNVVDPGSTFERFSGRESIQETPMVSELGFHRYMGGRI